MSLGRELKGDIQSLKNQIDELEREVKKLHREKADARTEVGYTDQILSLKRQLADLEVEKAKKQESFDRQTREVEHMVGLERKRSEFETKAAKREAELSVREQNLGEERRLFEDKMKSVTKNLEERISYLQDHLVTQLMESVRAAMPTVDLALGDRKSGSKAGASR